MGLIRFEGMIPVKLIILVVTALFAVSCACWNAMQPSRSIKIPPYRIEYYHSADVRRLRPTTRKPRDGTSRPWTTI